MAESAVWTVLDNWRCDPVEIIRETYATVYYKKWNGDRTKWNEGPTRSAFDWRGSEEEAVRLSARIKSAHGERDRRIQAANTWHARRIEQLLTRESVPDPEGDAPKPSLRDHP